jgi:S-adenosylhomocysteine hydrolase
MNTVTEAKTKDYVISDIKLAKFGRQEIAMPQASL